MSYTWEKAFTIAAPLITGTVEVTGVPEVGKEQTITVTINNGRTVDCPGTIVVEIRKPDETVVATLDAGTVVTVPASGSWNNSYAWTPTEAGDYKAVAVFTES